MSVSLHEQDKARRHCSLLVLCIERPEAALPVLPVELDGERDGTQDHNEDKVEEEKVVQSPLNRGELEPRFGLVQCSFCFPS